MADLIAVEFDDPTSAFDLRAELVKFQKEYLIEMEDVVVVTREAGGDVKLHQAVNLTAVGATGGAMWGALIGLLFLNPLVGAAIGAGAGALSGRLTDIGINDDTIREMAEGLPEGGSGLFVLVRRVTGDKLLSRLEGFRARGRVVHTSLSDEQEGKLKALLEKQASA